MEEKRIVVGAMEPRTKQAWNDGRNKQTVMDKRLRRNWVIFAAVFLCVFTGAGIALKEPQRVQSVMSHVTAGFEYDDTLGRLQFVSNILPESAMVFLETGKEEPCTRVVCDSKAIKHAWTEAEPWIEYANVGEVFACGDGSIATVVKNRDQEYTIRILHEHGCESIYSGLTEVMVKENDDICSGEQIGITADTAAFEWRKDGISVQPVFSDEK